MDVYGIMVPLRNRSKKQAFKYGTPEPSLQEPAKDLKRPLRALYSDSQRLQNHMFKNKFNPLTLDTLSLDP